MTSRSVFAVAAASVTAVLFSPLSGRLADRYGRRVVLVSGAAVMVVGYLALLLAPSLPGLAALRLLVGGDLLEISDAHRLIHALDPSLEIFERQVVVREVL